MQVRGMKRPFKRLCSSLIDNSVIGTLFAVVTVFVFPDVPAWFWTLEFTVGPVPVSLPSVGVVLVLLCFACKDLLFRNASIGKKMMGLVILDSTWSVPRVTQIMKRGLLVPSWGYISLMKNVLFGGETVADWEKNWEMAHLKTRVIEKKHFAELQRKCSRDDKEYSRQMERLFQNGCEKL